MISHSLPYCSRVKDQEPHSVPIMLVGNMCDKVNAREVSRGAFEDGMQLPLSALSLS